MPLMRFMSSLCSMSFSCGVEEDFQSAVADSVLDQALFVGERRSPCRPECTGRGRGRNPG